MGPLWSRKRVAEAELCLNMHTGEAGVQLPVVWEGQRAVPGAPQPDFPKSCPRGLLLSSGMLRDAMSYPSVPLA